MRERLPDILQRCLAEIDSGRASADECCERYPEHAGELRAALELRATGEAAQKPYVRSEAYAGGRQMLLTAVTERSQGGTKPMVPTPISTFVQRAAAVFVAAAVIVGSSAGITSAVSGDNVPAHVLDLVAGGEDRGRPENPGEQGRGHDDEVTADVTDGVEGQVLGEGRMHGLCTAATSGSDTGIEHKSDAPPFEDLEEADCTDEVVGQQEHEGRWHGLCTAYMSGSETGMEHKRQAPPFQALEDEAGPGGVAAFCAEQVLTGDGRPDFAGPPEGVGGGRPDFAGPPEGIGGGRPDFAGPPEGVGAGKPEGVGAGRPAFAGPPEGVGGGPNALATATPRGGGGRPAGVGGGRP
jgi:hypothetical protein